MQLDDFARDPIHTCHVCATRYETALYYNMLFPQPPCCPACDARPRTSCVPIGKDTAVELLLLLMGAPLSTAESSMLHGLPELHILRYARTEEDIDTIIDELRAAALALRGTSPSGQSPPPRDPARVARQAAVGRLHVQAESGMLASRLDDLRERTRALLRAEREHHLHVRAHRRARDADSSSARGS